MHSDIVTFWHFEMCVTWLQSRSNNRKDTGATVTKLPDANHFYSWLVVISLGQKIFSKAVWCRRGFPHSQANSHCHNNL